MDIWEIVSVVRLTPLSPLLDVSRCHGPTGLGVTQSYLLVQIPLSHFSPRSLIPLLVVLMFFWGLTLGYLSTFAIHLHSHVLHWGNNVLPQCSSPDRFTTMLPIILLPLSQPPLPPSINQYKVLSLSLAQQCLRLAGCVSPMQADSIHLLLQQFLWLDTGNSYTQCFPSQILSHKMAGSISKKGILLLTFWWSIL